MKLNIHPFHHIHLNQIFIIFVVDRWNFHGAIAETGCRRDLAEGKLTVPRAVQLNIFILAGGMSGFSHRTLLTMAICRHRSDMDVEFARPAYLKMRLDNDSVLLLFDRSLTVSAWVTGRQEMIRAASVSSVDTKGINRRDHTDFGIKRSAFGP